MLVAYDFVFLTNGGTIFRPIQPFDNVLSVVVVVMGGRERRGSKETPSTDTGDQKLNGSLFMGSYSGFYAPLFSDKR